MGQLDIRSQLYIRNLDFYGTRLDLRTILYTDTDTDTDTENSLFRHN